ncbi:MAG TPA: Uma2 family endonuclease [Acetobacteraceae bacterium]|nr:Uma2 family endonuclease [Acetobacteraceae bacterium]
MSDEIVIPPGPMTREEYYAWAEQQPAGRFELVDGRVVAMAPERVAHARVKAAAWLSLRNAIRAAGSRCEALIDGVAVEIDAGTSYQPDALVNCGERPDPNAKVAPAPVIVVEVTSPSTARLDAVRKLADYFRVPSIHHYLILDAEKRMTIHHQRRDDGTLTTRIAGSGPITLDPPGIAIRIEDLFEA